jgi:hypothetical protein
MNARTLPTVVAGIGVALCVAEVISFVQLSLRDDPNGFPAFALVFAGLFALGTLLIRWRQVVAGSMLVALLAAFEVVDYPTWTKHGTLDWIFDTTIAVVALAGICLALAVLVTRRSVLRNQPTLERSTPRANV